MNIGKRLRLVGRTRVCALGRKQIVSNADTLVRANFPHSSWRTRVSALLHPLSAAVLLVFPLSPPSPAAARPASPVGFYDEIKPVLAVRCYKCHTGENPKAGLLLDSLQHALAGGKSG